MKLAIVSVVAFPAVLALALASCAGGPDIAPEDVTYADVDAIFRARCLECHSQEKAEGELVLETYASLLKGGETGPVIVSGDADGSLLVQLIERREKPHMPMKARRLPAAEIAIIRAWIAGGARPGS